MLKGLVSIFLDFPCSLCQRPASKIVCHYCEQQLKTYQLEISQDLQRLCSPSPSLGHTLYPARSPMPIFVWGKYDGNLKQAIAAMKYNRLPDLGLMLGQWLGETWRDSGLELNPSEIMVVPIPLHPEKLKQRGFNQAQKIAEGFCSVTGYHLESKILKRIKQSQAMFNLNPAQRKNNIVNAFAMGKMPQSKRKKNKSVLLIDDIYTTGATVQEAAKVLQQRGVKVIGAAIVATPQP